MTHETHVLDVFAEARLAGNQLAVVLDADDLSTDEMQAIARETNFSETTFVESRELRDGGYDVRIFTPSSEIPFAGHPTLGTAWLLRKLLSSSRNPRIVLNLGMGQVPVIFAEEGDDALGFLRAPAATFGNTLGESVAAEILGVETRDVDPRGPVEEVSAGLDFLVVPLASADALRRARLTVSGHARLDQFGIRPFVYVFCTEPFEAGHDISSRFFFDAHGIREDPATGSATGALGGYLVRHRFLGTHDLDLEIEQGVAMGRPSLLHLRTRVERGGTRTQTGDEVEVRVDVGGHVFHVLEGSLL